MGEELSLYRFKEPKDVIEILKHNRTVMTLWHWETNNKEEALLVKGMGLILNIILDANERATELDSVSDVNKRLLLWKKYKTEERNRIFNYILKAGRGNGDK